MIKRFSHKGIKTFYETGSKAGIQSSHAPKLARQLARLNLAKSPADMNVPGWKLHPLKGDLAGYWAVAVSGNWRLLFELNNGDAVHIDYNDYH